MPTILFDDRLNRSPSVRRWRLAPLVTAVALAIGACGGGGGDAAAGSHGALPDGSNGDPFATESGAPVADSRDPAASQTGTPSAGTPSGGTPRAVVERLHAELERALAIPEVQAKLKGLGGEIGNLGVDEFGEFNRADYERFGKLIKDAGVKVEK